MRTPVEEAERLLGIAQAEWEGVFKVAAEWDEWDSGSWLTYIVDHDLAEMRLRELERLVEEGVMSPDQLARYEHLKALVAEARPVFDGLDLGMT